MTTSPLNHDYVMGLKEIGVRHFFGEHIKVNYIIKA